MMINEEKKQILKMVEDGKITAEEAIELLKAVELDDVEDEADVFETEASPSSTFEPDENLGAIADKVRSFWRIPLWIGVGFTVFGGLWMMSAMRASGFGFWFYCAWLPFLLGVLVVATAAGTRTSRWLFVHIKQAPGKTPQNITFGFPLPLRFGAWVLRNFGHMIPGVEATGAEEILGAMAETPAGESTLIVDVHDTEDHEHVQIFVG
ncbi:MAG: hypothetical protein HN855_06650 [Anaerolineae bacterium]|jgi:hypothetical protein|nr:hypothetical protein [Anaerolineae bacterium]MBT7071484.1 hypothetical protein [Anaerolineae bacterium]MBT7324817.1 hypothetical protein [Anaerolineae bacterium]